MSKYKCIKLDYYFQNFLEDYAPTPTSIAQCKCVKSNEAPPPPPHIHRRILHTLKKWKNMK